MIGGKVIDVARRIDRTALWCLDHRTGDECHVYISPTDDVPALGDDVWWQAGKVYWTPADRRFTDRPLTKVSYAWSENEP
jgi:hypothetical protein